MGHVNHDRRLCAKSFIRNHQSFKVLEEPRESRLNPTNLSTATNFDAADLLLRYQRLSQQVLYSLSVHTYER